jgi:hypothetical protein
LSHALATHAEAAANGLKRLRRVALQAKTLGKYPALYIGEISERRSEDLPA